MIEVANKICEAIPGAIVDFDITEGERAVGLAFLEAGKYFAVNNGPYYYSFDDPEYAPGGGMGANVLVFPGLARAVNARHTLNYDKWIPSTLFLTHYLPDDPEYSQWINIGSLILGQNGIWGDLPNISEAGVERFGTALSKYKEVSDDITKSHPVRSGQNRRIARNS
jgi:alpha-galactosidase